MMSEAARSQTNRTQVRHFINAHKVMTPFVVLAMMAWFGHWGVLPWVYLALHGTYCALWMIKEYTFRDRRFEQPIHPAGGVLFVFAMLGGYWIAPYLIVSSHLAAPGWLMALAISTTLLGAFLHFGADAQKHVALNLRKGLITDGLFARTRNPNYLGEMLIYAGFAMLARHWLVLLPLAWWWTYFVRNMLKKDRSLSRYPGFAAWKKKTGLLLPRLW